MGITQDDTATSDPLTIDPPTIDPREFTLGSIVALELQFSDN